MKTTHFLKFLFLVLISLFGRIYVTSSLLAVEAISAVPVTSETIPLAPQLDSSSAALSPPEIPINGAGEEYLPNLEKMQKHLKESNLLEFYLEAERLAKKIRFVRNEQRVTFYSLSGKEEVVACEWFSYYLAKSPFFPDAWLHDKDKYKEMDIKLKEFALEWILYANMEKRAKFHKMENRKLRKQYLSYAKVILKSLNTTSIELEKVSKQDMEKFYEEEKTWPQGILDEDEVWRRKGIAWTAYGISSIRGMRSDACVHVAELYQRELLLLLMDEYPNSASNIHAFFLEIGYSKEQLSRRFQKSIGKDKKTAYLYQGLPKPKE
jgi:hypothetical protein